MIAGRLNAAATMATTRGQTQFDTPWYVLFVVETGLSIEVFTSASVSPLGCVLIGVPV